MAEQKDDSYGIDKNMYWISNYNIRFNDNDILEGNFIKWIFKFEAMAELEKS